jgi:hypothetical protein
MAKLEGDRLTFDVEVLEGELTGGDGPAALFMPVAPYFFRIFNRLTIPPRSRPAGSAAGPVALLPLDRVGGCTNTLYDAHRYDIHSRLYRFVQVAGYECSYLSHESMIVNIPGFHGKNDRYAPGIGPCHFHDGPYGDLIGIQEIDKKRVATGYIVAISRYRPLRRTQ